MAGDRKVKRPRVVEGESGRESVDEARGVRSSSPSTRLLPTWLLSWLPMSRSVSTSEMLAFAPEFSPRFDFNGQAASRHDLRKEYKCAHKRINLRPRRECVCLCQCDSVRLSLCLTVSVHFSPGVSLFFSLFLSFFSLFFFPDK